MLSRDWERAFRSWAGGPGSTEERHCENALNAVRDAIANSASLRIRDTEVFLQGSYRNRVNIRQDSDVDIGILCRDTFYHDLPDGQSADRYGFFPADYSYPQFKNEVEQALMNHFGRPSVHRGNKAFDIKENTYRVDADVAPFFEHRRYVAPGRYHEGVELRPDKGGRVINWPKQHYDNGVSKNGTTSRRYKRIVRILKQIRNEMEDNRIATSKPVPGFLLECLVWNVPSDHFGNITYHADVRAALAFLFNNTMADSECSEWVEVSEFKYLFHSSQRWTRPQVHAFTDSAWDYIGFT